MHCVRGVRDVRGKVMSQLDERGPNGGEFGQDGDLVDRVTGFIEPVLANVGFEVLEQRFHLPGQGISVSGFAELDPGQGDLAQKLVHRINAKMTAQVQRTAQLFVASPFPRGPQQWRA